MEHEIWGGNLPAVTMKLSRGESVCTQSGGMCWMTDQIDMMTNAKGGVLKGLGRLLTGDSLFIATYTARTDGQEITFSATIPGEIKMFEIGNGYEIVAQKGAFLCSEPDVEITTDFTVGIKGGLFGGEGFLLQRYKGNGKVFCELDGSIREIDLAPGQTYKVDTGNVAAFEGTVTYSVEFVKGFKNLLFGGEGLALTTLTGPGKIWLQTMAIDELASRIIPFVPQKSN